MPFEFNVIFLAVWPHFVAFAAGAFGAYAVYVMFERKFAMEGKKQAHFTKSFYIKSKYEVIFVSAILAVAYSTAGYTTHPIVSIQIGASAPAIFGKMIKPPPIKE